MESYAKPVKHDGYPERCRNNYTCMYDGFLPDTHVSYTLLASEPTMTLITYAHFASHAYNYFTWYGHMRAPLSGQHVVQTVNTGEGIVTIAIRHVQNGVFSTTVCALLTRSAWRLMMVTDFDIRSSYPYCLGK